MTQSALQRVRVLNLYKRVLRSHTALPVDLKHLGDVYVKFRVPTKPRSAVALAYFHDLIGV